LMPVVEIRIVRVFVNHRRMTMPMGMRLSRRIAGIMGMPMMFVMPVPMFMQQLGMPMLVLVALRDMQIDTKPHQEARADQRRRDRLVKHGYGQNRTDEGSS